MHTVFAFSGTLGTRSSGDPVVLFRRRLSAWLASIIGTKVRLDPARPRILAPTPESSIRWAAHCDGSLVLYELDVELSGRPPVPPSTWLPSFTEGGVPSPRWSARVSYLADEGAPATLTLDVGVSDPTRRSMPGGRPDILATLARDFHLQSGGTPWRVPPTVLGEADIPHWVSFDLLDPSRREPILLLTPAADGCFPVDPVVAAAEFAGLARTLAIDLPESTFVLTDRLGTRALSCFYGAARLYVPGFTTADDPFRHRLMLLPYWRRPEERKRLAEQIAPWTVERFEEPGVLTAARSAADVAQEKERTAVIASLAPAAHTVDESLEGLRREVADLWAELGRGEELRRALRAEADALRDRLTGAEKARRCLAYRLREVLAGRPDPDAGRNALPPASVLEVVEQADSYFGEHLLLLRSALQSAEESPYDRPDEVQRALRAMAAVAATRRTDSLGVGLRDAFAQHGLVYKSDIAETTPKRLRRQYEFRMPDGSAVECTEHLALGTSYDPAHCLRIYFSSTAAADGRFVVGHVGRHLESMSTT
jgi:hypothetical protein